MSDELPDVVKAAVDALLRCGDEDLRWIRVGMNLMLKALITEITDGYLAKQSIDIAGWSARVYLNLDQYTREDLARITLGWYKSMQDFEAFRNGGVG